MMTCGIGGQAGNLGEREQNKRLRAGVFAAALAMLVAAVVLKLDLAAPFRLALFFPFLFAANGIYMGLYRT